MGNSKNKDSGVNYNLNLNCKWNVNTTKVINQPLVLSTVPNNSLS